MAGIKPPRDWLQRQKKQWVLKAVAVNIIILALEAALWVHYK